MSETQTFSLGANYGDVANLSTLNTAQITSGFGP